MRGSWLLLLVCLACAPTDRASQVGATPTDDAKPDPTPLVDGASGWYDRRRVLDVTGDGLPDTLQLVARGPRTDSLVMLLMVRTQGDSIIIASWGSDYDFIDPPDELRVPGVARDSALRERYDRVLREASVEPHVDSTLMRPWTPSAEFYDCEGNTHHCVMLDALTRAHPDVRLDSLDGLPFDTAFARRVVADLASRDLVALTFSYGYESTESVVWSPVSKSFVTVFYCC